MMFCADARKLLEELDGPEILNQTVLANLLDDFVKNDVKAIFSAIYGGENAVRRIALANVQITVEMMKENLASAIVQLAGVRRLCLLLANANAVLYTPTAGNQSEENKTTATGPLFREMDTFGAVELVTSTLRRFDVDKYLSLYVHICRFISFVAVEGRSPKLSSAGPHAALSHCPSHSRLMSSFAGRNTKLVGQHGGVEGAIDLLFKARTMQREKKQEERDEAVHQRKLLESPQSDWQSIVEPKRKSKPPPVPPPPAPVDASDGSSAAVVVPTSLASLAVVDFTPTEIGQQALWALDLLTTLDFNVSQMKLHKLKYLLEEIRLDPDGKELGEALIVTRRLRLIRWDQVGLPSGSSSSSSSPTKTAKGIAMK